MVKGRKMIRSTATRVFRWSNSEKTPIWMALLMMFVPLIFTYYQSDQAKNDAVLSRLVQKAGVATAAFLPALNQFSNEIMDAEEFDRIQGQELKNKLIDNVVSQYTLLDQIVPYLAATEKVVVRDYMTELVDFKTSVEGTQDFDQMRGFFSQTAGVLVKKDRVVAILFDAVGAKREPDSQNI